MTDPANPRPAKWIQWLPSLAASLVFLACVASMWEPGTGFTRLIRFGDYFSPRAVPQLREVPIHVYEDSHGYDAQFYAQMALDPLLRCPLPSPQPMPDSVCDCHIMTKIGTVVLPDYTTRGDSA